MDITTRLVISITITITISLAAFTSGEVNADTVITDNGATLVGKVTVVTPGSVVLDTEYAGSITIDAARISRLVTDTAVSTRLEDGTVVTGTTEINGDGMIVITNDTMTMRASVDKLMASWVPENKPPKEAGFPMERRWKYSVGADITGKRGNSEENGTSIRADASLVSDNDELNFYVTVDRADKDGDDTSDEIIVGSSYVSYFSEVIGWYVSTELERDPFESIDLRTSLSGGLSYWVFNRPGFSLELQTGLGYRFESYEDGSNDDTPTADIRLHNHWQLNSWINMTNNLSFRPSLSDFGDFLLVQDSGINMPIGSSRWSLRLGLKNNYANEPVSGRKKLDTTYYSRLLMNFE